MSWIEALILAVGVALIITMICSSQREAYRQGGKCMGEARRRQSEGSGCRQQPRIAEMRSELITGANAAAKDLQGDT